MTDTPNIKFYFYFYWLYLLSVFASEDVDSGSQQLIKPKNKNK